MEGTAVKFRPIKPRSPHLNGKVEPSQKTDLDEFWSAVDLKADDLQQKLDEWQRFYNNVRPHGAIGNQVPMALVRLEMNRISHAPSGPVIR